MKRKKFSTLFLYILGYLLIWEWLRPIEQLTDTNHIGLFHVFLILSFATFFFQLHWYVALALDGGYILFSIYYLHYKQVFLSFAWLASFVGDLKKNLLLLTTRDYDQLSNEFRTLLFFILLSMMVYLLDYWMIKRRQILLFFLMTIVYITVLDTFTAYKANGAIVRTVVIGFVALGLLKLYRILSAEDLDNNARIFRRWLIPFTLMVAVSMAVGFAAPKAGPIWPDPVPFFTASKDSSGNNSTSPVSRIGYRQNDSQLGGPFTGDNTVVFRVEAAGKSYWRVETRDTYTGKGWVSASSGAMPFLKNELVPNENIPSSVPATDEKATIISYTGYPFLIYPAGIQTVSAANGVTFRMDPGRDKIYTLNAQQKMKSIDRYSIRYSVPRYNVADLTKTENTASSDPRMKGYFLQRYTQLPTELPLRVGALADQVTAGKTNSFDKAQAIEAYLNGPGFTYDQKNVAIPGDQVDYVDQFLFDSKRGYCDNFSTSMVVMLRTLGIPARWVKGFNGGDFVQYSQKGSMKQVYEITNNNAHSWVEVYFPNQGWVPFEPTKGFDNGVEFNNRTSPGTTPNKESVTPPPVKEKPSTPQKDNNRTSGRNKSLMLKGLWLKAKLYLMSHSTALTVYFLTLGIVVGAMYRIRRKWIPFFLLVRFRFRKSNATIGPAYLALLKQLHRYGIKRKDSETLRNYAAYVDSFFSIRDMTKLTKQYERFVYGQTVSEESWRSTRELWENLIKKTIA